jgi:hypothetical protein
MTFPSAIQTLQKCRGQGEGKLQFLQSFQADRRAADCLTSIECPAAMSLRPASTMLGDVSALHPCQGFNNSSYA